MHIARLRIFGFRGVRKADIYFNKQSVIVGPNGCGKSTVIDSLSLVLGKTRMVRNLTEHDFIGSDPKPASRIRIVATMSGFTSNDATEFPNWFRSDRAIPKWMSPTGIEFADNGEDRSLCVNVGFCARFDRDELEIQTLRYFHDDDDLQDPFDDEGALTPISSRLLNEIGFFVLPARRDWEAIASFNSDLFRRTVSNSAGIPAEEILNQRDALRLPSLRIEDASRLSNLVSGLNNSLAKLAPNAPKFQLRLTAGDSESLLQALLPHYARANEPSLPALRHGSGLVSLQSLLLLLEVGKARKGKGLPFLLALEEPELHLSPGVHGRLISETIATSDQVICTTHSSEVARTFAPTSILVISNTNGDMFGRSFLSKTLSSAATNNERKFYFQNRSRVVAALMHSIVLVPEGRFDAEWLGRLAEIADPLSASTSPFGALFGIIPTENGAVVETVSRIVPLRPHVVALVDGDPAGDAYIQALIKLPKPPAAVIQLPLGWTIEAAVCWILDPSGVEGLKVLTETINGLEFSTFDDFLKLLKLSNDRAANKIGLKEDIIAHEVIAGVIDAYPACQARAVTFCEALVRAAIGVADAHLQSDSPFILNTRVVRFKP